MPFSDENYVENCVTCLTDSPDVHVVSLPHLRPQLKVNAVHLVGRLDLLVVVVVVACSGSISCCPPCWILIQMEVLPFDLLTWSELDDLLQRCGHLQYSI